jgi:hypothetical protein
MTPTPSHLVRRFFGVLRAGPLAPLEQAEVARLLRPAERDLFWAQPHADQRHGLESARAVAARRPEREDLARAALLHDVGKRHAALGAVARSLATTLGFLHLPLPARYAAYLEHGPAGAADLEAAGAEGIVVAFARHHHIGRPEDFDATDWADLCRADHS